MLEAVVSILLIFAIAAWCGLFSVFKSFQNTDVADLSADHKLKVPEDSVLKRHFFTHLQSEIEATLFPRPTDSVLRRHYDSLVVAELEKRLAKAE